MEDRTDSATLATGRDGSIAVRAAGLSDVSAIVEILTEAARHQQRFRAGGGWPVPFPREPIEEGIRRREFHVAERGPVAVATFSLSWDDPRFWGPQPPVAGYLHKLAVRRSEAHLGVGRELIEWIARRTRAEGRSLLRLDCLAANARLVAYYEAAGFRKVRAIRLGPPAPPFDFQLMERTLDERSGATNR